MQLSQFWLKKDSSQFRVEQFSSLIFSSQFRVEQVSSEIFSSSFRAEPLSSSQFFERARAMLEPVSLFYNFSTAHKVFKHFSVNCCINYWNYFKNFEKYTDNAIPSILTLWIDQVMFEPSRVRAKIFRAFFESSHFRAANFSSIFEPSHFRAANFSSEFGQCSSQQWLVPITTTVLEKVVLEFSQHAISYSL